MVLTLPPPPPALYRGISGLGTAMSTVDIYNLARDAGFPPDMAVRMTAVALRESGGDPSAYNGTGMDNSYGLWQINMYGNLGPARLAQFGLSDPSQLLDPATNARVAYQIWNGSEQNFQTAWYQDATQYLPQATEAAMGETAWDGSSIPSDVGLEESSSSTGMALVVGAALLGAILLLR